MLIEEQRESVAIGYSSADAEPNGSKAFDSHDCYRLSRAADRSAEHDRYFSSATSGSEVLHRLVRL
jgi:hypothetical protein